MVIAEYAMSARQGSQLNLREQIKDRIEEPAGGRQRIMLTSSTYTDSR